MPLDTFNVTAGTLPMPIGIAHGNGHFSNANEPIALDTGLPNWLFTHTKNPFPIIMGMLPIQVCTLNKIIGTLPLPMNTLLTARSTWYFANNDGHFSNSNGLFICISKWTLWGNFAHKNGQFPYTKKNCYHANRHFVRTIGHFANKNGHSAHMDGHCEHKDWHFTHMFGHFAHKNG